MIELLTALVAMLFVAGMVLAWRYGKASAQPELQQFKDEVKRLQEEVDERTKAQARDAQRFAAMRAEHEVHSFLLQDAKQKSENLLLLFQAAQQKVMGLTAEVEKLNGQLRGARARAKRKELAAQQSQTDELS